MATKLISLTLSALLAYALAGCGGVYSTNGATGTTGEACGRGEALPSPTCNGRSSCVAGYVPGVVCTASGRFGDCTCVPGTAADAGTTPATGVCTDSETRYNPALACPAGRVGYQTCRYGVWTANECVADLGGARICVPNSPTMNSCMTCSSGYIAQQRCSADGRSYAACECVWNGSTGTTCTPGVSRGSCNPCASGSAAGNDVCSPNGMGYTCQLAAGASCPSSGGNCTNGTTQSCSITCAGGTSVTGTQTCNSGAWTACPAVCTNMTGGDQMAQLQLDPNVWRYANLSNGTEFCTTSQLNVRFFDGNGQQVRSPITMNRSMVVRAWKAGSLRADVVCGDSAEAPLHPAFYNGTISAGQVLSGSRGGIVASVTGGVSTSAMASQVGTLRFCNAPGGIKLELAIDPDMVGRCINQ